jgi:2'-hydroxyisoflavone reductase
VLTRGTTPDELPAAVERLRGDRNAGADGLAATGNRAWDAVVDVSGYTPKQVTASARRFAASTGRYVFVSTCSVYEPASEGPLSESQALLPAADAAVTDVTAQTYGPLKVACERIVEDAFGTRSTMVRPQIVAGPFDPTGRHTYWVQRATQPGEMLVPGDGEDHVQVVDARDVARFTVLALEQGLGGAFNLAGPRLTWRGFVDALGAVGPVWVDSSALESLGLTWTDLPLFIPRGAPQAALMHVSSAKTRATGLELTGPRQTIADTRAWLRAHPMTPVLTPDRERDAVAFAKARGLVR